MGVLIVRFLTEEEYDARREAFLEENRETVKQLIVDKMAFCKKEVKKRGRWKEFFSNCSGGAVFVLIVAAGLMIKEVISLEALIGTVAVVFWILIWAHIGWEKLNDNAGFYEFMWQERTIVCNFIYEKKLEALSASMTVEEYLKTDEFYSVAEHEIPDQGSFVSSFDLVRMWNS